MADQIFKAETKLQEGLAVRCEARGMNFTLDEPPELGGTDTGMNPVEALLSALGACKCIVARAFAKSNKIKLHNVNIVVEGVLDPDGFMGANPEAKIGFSEVKTTYHFEADNTKEELEAFVQFIETHCPVQDTLSNPATYISEIA